MQNLLTKFINKIAAPVIPQPPVVNYNRTNVLWTDEQCYYLLNQRMYRNDEFWTLSPHRRREFWQSIANKINEVFGTRFTYKQVNVKWNNLLEDYKVR